MVTSRTVWLVMEDDVAAQKLLEIARTHCKLALEHGDKSSPERCEAIKQEIQRLRAEQEALLKFFEEEGRV
ncbi:hypothetical protein ACE41H_20285 [Paenibacillus enshidis]|uniref:Uncharacterized protein n=1 Tax=Paenibacillus enshidis TaxID=1458439 RepID=A0ABV5AY19_9BACL